MTPSPAEQGEPSTMASTVPTLAPSAISRLTLSRLLAHYPATAENAYRAKMIGHANRITKGAAKRRAQMIAADESAGIPRPPPSPPLPENDPMVPQPRFEREVQKFVKLDTWRYGTVAGVLRERRDIDPEPVDMTTAPAKKAKRWVKDVHKQKRNVHKKYDFVSVVMEAEADAAKKEGNAEKHQPSNMYFDKDQFMRLLDWQSKRDVVRPTAMGMAKRNPPFHVKAASRFAISRLPTNANEFPDESINMICDAMRGVLPPTASLFLSIASDKTDPIGTGFEVPFFSDELFYWLVGNVYPWGGEPLPQDAAQKKKKQSYDFKPYRHMMRKFAAVRSRVNSASARGEDSPFSATDIEKAAFVIAHMDVSPYKLQYGGGEEAVGVPDEEWEGESSNDESDETSESDSDSESASDSDSDSDSDNGKPAVNVNLTGSRKRKR